MATRAVQSEIYARDAGTPTKTKQTLTFGELESLASAFLAILLALVLARVAGQKTELLEPGSQLQIELAQRTGDSMSGGAGLTGNTSAIDAHQDVEFIGRLGRQQRLAHGGAGGFGGEVILEGPAIDGEIPFTWPKNHTGHRFLTAAGTNILNCACCH